MKKRFFTESEVLDIKEKFVNGVPFSSLTKEYKCNTRRIAPIVKNLIKKNQKIKINENNEFEFIKDFDSGMSHNDLEEKYVLGYNKIIKLLKKYKRKPRSRGDLNKKQFDDGWIERVKALYDKERSLRACSKTFKLDCKCIKERLLKKYPDLKIYNKPLEEDSIKEAIIEYEKNLIPLCALAKRHKVSVSTLKKEFFKKGVTVLNRRVISAVLNEKESETAKILYEKGMSICEIAKKILKGLNSVRKDLEKNGVNIKLHFNQKSRRFGYVGTYKHFIFRSLMELSFICDHEEHNKIESAERKHVIKYRFNGQILKYHPDFILNDKKIVEIKPSCFLSDKKVIAKCKAAKKYCIKNNLDFEIIEWKTDKDRIKKMFLSGEIKILNRSNQEAKKYLGIIK